MRKWRESTREIATAKVLDPWWHKGTKTVRAQEPSDVKSVRDFAILCVRNVHMYVFGNTDSFFE